MEEVIGYDIHLTKKRHMSSWFAGSPLCILVKKAREVMNSREVGVPVSWHVFLLWKASLVHSRILFDPLVRSLPPYYTGRDDFSHVLVRRQATLVRKH